MVFMVHLPIALPSPSRSLVSDITGIIAFIPSHLSTLQFSSASGNVLHIPAFQIHRASICSKENMVRHVGPNALFGRRRPSFVNLRVHQ